MDLIRQQSTMTGRTYLETFDDGPGGWVGWIGGGGGQVALDCHDSAVTTRSPWGVDINHAPPGAGYLHLLYVLLTQPMDVYRCRRARFDPLAGPNRFVLEGYPRDFTNARFHLRVRGQADLKGSQLVLLIQSDLPGVRTNHILLAQPVRVTPEWSEQTLVLEPDDRQWLPMGVRRTGADSSSYGNGPIAPSLARVNVNLMLVLFPLEVVPAGPIPGDPHELRAGKDYPIDTSRLPSGWVSLDEVRIDFQS